MRSNSLSKTTNHVKKDGRQDSKVNRVRKEHTLGEVIWVKTNPSSWWLGQVVDENTVSVKSKPKRKLVGEILVRLYGSYTYLYADPEKCRDELMEILKQNNGSNREMFKKALEQEIAYTKSSALKRKISEHKEKARDGAPKDKKLKPNGVNKNQEVDCLSSGSMGKLPKIRFRVLRTRKAKGFPENLEDVGGSKTHVNSGDLSSGRTRRKTSEVEISKQDGVKKGHKADNQGSGIANMKSTSLKRKVSERKARDGGPKDKESKQNGVNKNQEVGGLSSQQGNIGKLPPVRTRVFRTRKAKSFPKNLEVVSRAQTQVNRGDVSSGRTRKETSKSDISKQDGVKKGKKTDNQGSVKSSKNLEHVSRAQTQVNRGDVSSGRTRKETSKTDISKQVGVQKGKKADNQGSAKGLPEKLEGVSRAKTQVKGGDLSSGRTKKETSNNENLKQDGVKKGQKTDNQGTGTDILGNSPDLSLRRVKVMEILALVAPCGSPFKKNGLTSSNL
ncbi:PWWP domain [Macleaya cordata]|uniref:PWWP domain n=1 Tax=Macleaya cordata TaxID=56857 RepID=A0A200PU93_MACCD|nr:PWWP domain [Macleaya cordata]